MIKINNEIIIDEQEIIEKFARSSGPGGQHVNKVSTKVELRFNLKNNKNLPENVKNKLSTLSGKKINNKGEIILKAEKYSSQFKNRELAREKLKKLILKSLEKEHERLITKPNKKIKIKRMKKKINRSNLKVMRKKIKF